MAQTRRSLSGGVLHLRGAGARQALQRRPKRGGLAPLWPAAGIHQPEAQAPAGQRTLSLRSFTFKLRGRVRAAARLRLEVAKLYQLHEQEREARAVQYQARPVPRSGKPAYSCLSLERFRNAAKFHDRPAAADIAFCVAAISLGCRTMRLPRSLTPITCRAIPTPPGALPIFAAR